MFVLISKAMAVCMAWVILLGWKNNPVKFLCTPNNSLYSEVQWTDSLFSEMTKKPRNFVSLIREFMLLRVSLLPEFTVVFDAVYCRLANNRVTKWDFQNQNLRIIEVFVNRLRFVSSWTHFIFWMLSFVSKLFVFVLFRWQIQWTLAIAKPELSD